MSQAVQNIPCINESSNETDNDKVKTDLSKGLKEMLKITVPKNSNERNIESFSSRKKLNAKHSSSADKTNTDGNRKLNKEKDSKLKSAAANSTNTEVIPLMKIPSFKPNQQAQAGFTDKTKAKDNKSANRKSGSIQSNDITKTDSGKNSNADNPHLTAPGAYVPKSSNGSKPSLIGSPSLLGTRPNLVNLRGGVRLDSLLGPVPSTPPQFVGNQGRLNQNVATSTAKKAKTQDSLKGTGQSEREQKLLQARKGQVQSSIVKKASLKTWRREKGMVIYKTRPGKASGSVGKKSETEIHFALGRWVSVLFFFRSVYPLPLKCSLLRYYLLEILCRISNSG